MEKPQNLINLWSLPTKIQLKLTKKRLRRTKTTGNHRKAPINWNEKRFLVNRYHSSPVKRFRPISHRFPQKNQTLINTTYFWLESMNISLHAPPIKTRSFYCAHVHISTIFLKKGPYNFFLLFPLKKFA